MATHTSVIKLKTKPQNFYNITEKVQQIVKQSDIENGLCIIFSPGSTGAIILNEDTPTLLEDIRNSLKKVANKGEFFQHPENAHSHIHATILGCNQTIPIDNGNLILGNWQDIIFVELDTTEREREIVVTIIGD